LFNPKNIMEREKELQNWLQKRYPQRSFTLSFAAADADFRRDFLYDERFIDCERVHCVLSKFHIGAIVRKRTVRGKEDEKYMCDVFLYGIVMHCFCL